MKQKVHSLTSRARDDSALTTLLVDNRLEVRIKATTTSRVGPLGPSSRPIVIEYSAGLGGFIVSSIEPRGLGSFIVSSIKTRGLRNPREAHIQVKENQRQGHTKEAEKRP